MAASRNLETALVSEDDDLLLYAMQNGVSKGVSSLFRPDFSRFDIQLFTDDQCKAMFRFKNKDLFRYP